MTVMKEDGHQAQECGEVCSPVRAHVSPEGELLEVKGPGGSPTTASPLLRNQGAGSRGLTSTC